MKLKELLAKLSDLPPDYGEAEIEISVQGRYEYHKLSIEFITRGSQSKGEKCENYVSIMCNYINKPDEVRKDEKLRTAAAKLKISFGVPKEFTDDYEDFIKFTKDTGNWRELEFTVNLKDHSIIDWKKKNGRSGYLFYKVVDAGTYTLLDENDKIIKELNGYVPNHLIPEPDGYGDYIELKVNPEGIITNWSKDDSFHEFSDGSEDLDD
jgi:hypothetical protein